jgi:uncharacterized protein
MRLLLGIAMASLLLGCAGEVGVSKARLLNPNGSVATIEIEIAETAAELEVGLTGRVTLPANRGMLFVIRERGPGFWMKDVMIPLSVAFIDGCGKVIAIQDMEPQSTRFHDTPAAYSFGLEVNKGWFEQNGVEVGSVLELPPRLREPTCLEPFSMLGHFPATGMLWLATDSKQDGTARLE